ncbi:VOC family protein [Mycobacterium sp. IDR2000157661]|uniref:VOC family protein n=1 Tax=Mycobacterium sp. IDR2000157661 TaxID=2867005 RepID=UPI001EEB6B9F|nr:hypothetical protein [Mycobacterium sp. IDR2000157661]ULE31724.1 hypothetical protein K3G64_16165 [Mycobacterium sp. IDR2000157661]
MPSSLHHVVMRSHSAPTLIEFLSEVVGVTVQFRMHVPGEVLEKTLDWPPSAGADVTMLGSGDAGLIEVLDVPEQLRAQVPEGLAALSFMAGDFGATRERASSFANDVTMLDTGVPGVDLFFCTMGGVPMEFVGSYAPEPNSAASNATNS